jgi:TetR/AcrR family transcriptional regulator, transcriptional repressor for nem operon
VPYPAEHKVRVRGRIVESARRLFNRHGFEQVSIDQIMAGAGLTRGGFYHHFSSKDELYAAAIGNFTSCNPFTFKAAQAKPQISDPRKLARMLIDVYLSDEVLENIDLHCPLYALPGDVARAGLTPQQAYTDLIRGMANDTARPCGVRAMRSAVRKRSCPFASAGWSLPAPRMIRNCVDPCG